MARVVRSDPRTNSSIRWSCGPPRPSQRFGATTRRFEVRASDRLSLRRRSEVSAQAPDPPCSPDPLPPAGDRLRGPRVPLVPARVVRELDRVGAVRIHRPQVPIVVADDAVLEEDLAALG